MLFNFARTDREKSIGKVISEIGLPTAKRYLLKTDSTTRNVMKDASNTREFDGGFCDAESLNALIGAKTNANITMHPMKIPLSNRMVI
jgi:hypothetical protein